MKIYIDTDFPQMELNAALAQVSEQRRKQALGFKHDSDRLQSLAVYLLLRRALKETFGIDDEPVFGYEDGGKPYIVGHPEVCFNMSHCRCAVACAVSHHPVGIDIETIRPFRDSLARYTLNDEEYRHVATAERPDAEFIRLWTMKESLLKLTGRGLRDNLKTLLPYGDVEFKTIQERDFICTVCQNVR